MLLLVSLLYAFSGASAFAEGVQTAPPSTPTPPAHPCKKLTAACKAGGYLPGQRKEGKGLHVDCMKKLLDGASVEGVTVAATDVSECKAKKAKKGARKNTAKPPNDATSTD
jgi:hypothetical protein